MDTIPELYEGCRTYRRFKQRPVSQAILKEIANTARKRSSGMNAQPLRCVVAQTPEAVKAIQPHLHWAAKLPKAIGTPKSDEQPTAFVIVLTPKKATPLTQIDMGIALDTMALTAWAHGVGSCMLYAIDRKALSRIVPVPDGFSIAMVLALGYPAHESTIVSPDSAHGLNYYVDDKRDYFVPKRPADEVISFI